MTLSEFKRRFVVGATVFHVRSTMRGDISRTYEVCRVQRNGCYFKQLHLVDIPETQLWLLFPRADELSADENGFTITRAGGESVYLWSAPAT